MDNFFSDKNTDLIYGIVRDKILQQTNYDIDSSSKYYSNMTPLMKKVYNSIDQNNRGDLLYLNKTALSTIVPFFSKTANKKTRQNSTQGYGIPNQITSNYTPNTALNPRNNIMENPISSNGQYNSNVELTLMKNKEDVGSQMDKLQNERNALNKNLTPEQQIPDFNLNMDTNNSNIANEYQNLVQKRDNYGQSFTQKSPPSPQDLESFQNQIKDFNFSQSTPQNNKPTGFQMESFDFDANVGQDLGQPLYENITSLNESDKDIKQLHEMLQQNRQDESYQYKVYQQQEQEMKQNQDATKIMTLQEQTQLTSMDEVGSYLERRSRAGINTNNKNSVGSKPADIYSPVQISEMQNSASEQEQRILQHVDNQSYFVNKLPEENQLFQKFLEGLREGYDQFGKRDYIETTHYVTINSQDRLWENNAENRYDFVVHFNSSDYTTGAAVTKNFKNIVAIELIKLIIPQDFNPIPFDQRLYIDFLSYPYLSLHIDELDGVYNGTNNTTTRAFEHLVFDKEYTSTVLTNEQITSEHTTSGIKHKFSNQYKRGYFALKPACEAKKVYYHTPKASLNRLTIKLLTSEGIILNTLYDHLEILTIAYESTSNQELKLTNGFPRTNGQNIIKITTVNYFTNKIFRIGDKIKIKNYTVSSSGTNDAKFQNFINRYEGHYIINLDENETGVSQNEGYLNNLFIAPPGDIDYSTGALDTSTYYTATPTVSNPGNLINISLQMHLMFKITTREDKSRNVLHPFNI